MRLWPQLDYLVKKTGSMRITVLGLSSKQRKTRRAKMTFDSFLKSLGLRPRSLAERVNNKVLSGYEPSKMAGAVVGKVSTRKINNMWVTTSDKFNKINNEKQ